MLNTYFNLPTYITSDNYQVANIFPTYKNLKIPASILSQNMFYYKDIPDDTRLDLLAYLEYGDSKYWDVLFYINNMDHVFDLPTNGDNVILSATKKLNNLEAKLGNISSTELRNQTYEKYLLEAVTTNERHRNFRFVQRAYLPALLGAINGS